MKNKFTSLDLKIIALIFMVVEHVYSYFGNNLGLPAWFHLLGRFVAPLFLYLIMEGFKYTRSRKKYLTRLFTGAMIMHAINIINNLLTNDIHENFYNSYTNEFEPLRILQGHNIFWTFFLIMAMFIMLDKIKNGQDKKAKLWIIPAILIIPFIFFSEGGIYLFPISLACFYFNNDKKKVSMAILIWSLILLANTLNSALHLPEDISMYQHITFSSDFMMMTSIPFILMYNGKRGGQGKKWEKTCFIYSIHYTLLLFIYW